ncbi:MAG: HAD family phosphatase [Bryobacteraceae bacterium]|nr:HAD family phosphatase [Bryobacteraceae bacterium]
MASGLALLFDLDGVIVDTMPLHLAAWREYLSRAGVATEYLEDKMHGRRNDELVRELFGAHLSEQEVFDHGAAKEALFRELAAPRLEEILVPGLREFLETHVARPKAVGSNAEPANIAFTLEGLGLAHHFAFTVDGHQVERPKPHPDIYLRAAQLLDRDPRACIVFEDSPTGVTAAHAAGMRVVGVDTARALAATPVDLVITDFRDPALAVWISKQQPGTL